VSLSSSVSQISCSIACAQPRRPSARVCRLWILGFAIFITSNVLGTIFQVGALPIVVLAPLGAVSLLWNALFARFMLGDVFTPWMVLGTLNSPICPMEHKATSFWTDRYPFTSQVRS
jgi:hypothetical protein